MVYLYYILCLRYTILVGNRRYVCLSCVEIFVVSFSEEIEELSGRLKASRQRVADLERSLSTSSQSGQQLEKVCR